MKRITLLAIFSVLLSGCGIAYQSNRSQLLKTATVQDYGIQPPDNYKEIEKSLIVSKLKDPDSAKFQFGSIYRDAIPGGFTSPKAVLVWRHDVMVNAKNSYGGYVGFQPYRFAWRDGRIFAVAYPDLSGGPYFCWEYVK